MKKLQIGFVLIAFLLISLNSSCCRNCDDDGHVNQELTEINGGEVSTFQFVQLKRNDLFQNEYKGALGEIQLTLLLDAENGVLVFQIPENAPLGENELIVADLKLSIKYNILETTLENEPEVELEPLFNEITSFQSILSNTDESFKEMKNFIESFNDFFSNTTDQEKQELALTYSANKEFFEDAFKNDLAAKINIDGTDLEILGKMTLSAVGFGASLFITLSSLPNLAIAALSALATYAFYTKLIQYKNEFNDRKLNVITMVIDDVKALYDKNQNNIIELTSGVQSSFDLKSERRDFIASDNDGNNANTSDYFNTIAKANTVVSKFNTAIDFINNNFFFSEVKSVPTVVINQEKPIESVLEKEGFFNKISFSIENTNVNITNVSFENGSLNMTATIIDETSVDELVDTRINFSYEDDFNRLTGSFPAKINKENSIDIVGVWKLIIPNDITCPENSGISAILAGEVTIEFLSDGTLILNGITNLLGTYEINENTISLLWDNSTNSPVDITCNDGSIVSVNITNFISFIGTFNGQNFNGNYRSFNDFQISCTGVAADCIGDAYLEPQ